MHTEVRNKGQTRHRFAQFHRACSKTRVSHNKHAAATPKCHQKSHISCLWSLVSPKFRRSFFGGHKEQFSSFGVWGYKTCMAWDLVCQPAANYMAFVPKLKTFFSLCVALNWNCKQQKNWLEFFVRIEIAGPWIRLSWVTLWDTWLLPGHPVVA